MKHDSLERNVGLLAVLIAVAISFGGLAEIIPLMNQTAATEPAPHLTQRPLVPTHELDDTALIELMLRHGAPVELRDRELSAGALRLLRADLAVCESFVAGEPEPLAVPIVAFAGDADPLAAVAAVAGWERHTRGRFAMHTLEGDHFFIRRSRDRLLALLQRELAPGLVDATAAEVMAPLVTAEAP